MMKRLDFLKLIAQQSQRFFLRAIQAVFSCSQIFAGLANSSAVLSEINPRQWKRDAGIHFAHGLPSVIVTLRFDHQCRIRNPLATRELKFPFFHVDPCFRHFDFGSVCEDQWSKRSWRELRHLNACRRRPAQRRESVTVHQRVKLCLLIGKLALEIALRFLQFALISFCDEHIRRALRAGLVFRATDVGNLL